MKNVSAKQQFFLVLFSLGIIALLFVLGTKKVSDEVVEEPIIETPTETVAEWPSTEIRTETIDQSDTTRKITAQYPITKSESVNAYFKQFVDTQISQFKDDTSWVNDPEIASSAEGNMSLDIAYAKERSAHADTYVFRVGSYTGGAHGLTITKTFSFSKEGKLVQLGDIFTNGLSGLTAIAPYVQGELMKREFADKEWIMEGTNPIEDNYRNIVITDTGLRVTFDPYQVAAYAAGEQVVEVPLKVFKSIANPAYFTIQ